MSEETSSINGDTEDQKPAHLRIPDNGKPLDKDVLVHHSQEHELTFEHLKEQQVPPNIEGKWSSPNEGTIAPTPKDSKSEEQTAANSGPSARLPRQCFGCGNANSEQRFCGACGKPLGLQEFVAQSVKENLKDAVRDKSLLETDVAFRVGERIYNWLKIAAAAFLVFLTPLGFLGYDKYKDVNAAVDSAKSALSGSVEQFKKTVENEKTVALKTVDAASATVSQKSAEFDEAASRANKQIGQNTDQVRRLVNDVTAQVRDASETKSAVNAMKVDLSEALSKVNEHQRVLLNRDVFLKEVFSSFKTEIVPFDKIRSVLTQDPARTALYMLLEGAPVPESVQVQVYIFAQPRDSYFAVDNVLVFFWQGPLGSLKERGVSVTYFADRTKSTLVKGLELRDGRMFGDDQPFPIFGGLDPAFKGNRWFTAAEYEDTVKAQAAAKAKKQ